MCITSSINFEWIIDSCATNHIIYQLHLLINPSPLQVILYLLGGTTTPITQCGSLQLKPDVMLHQVLCSPTFKCNFISIPKVTVHSSCTVSFFKFKCLMQAPHQ